MGSILWPPKREKTSPNTKPTERKSQIPWCSGGKIHQQKPYNEEDSDKDILEENDEKDKEEIENGNHESMDDDIYTTQEDTSTITPQILTYNEDDKEEITVDLPPSPTMNKFITEYFSDHQGEPIFPRVWGLSNIKIQIHYKTINQNQAEEILAIIHPELAKHMTEISI
jgi:hypothetical protein